MRYFVIYEKFYESLYDRLSDLFVLNTESYELTQHHA